MITSLLRNLLLLFNNYLRLTTETIFLESVLLQSRTYPVVPSPCTLQISRYQFLCKLKYTPWLSQIMPLEFCDPEIKIMGILKQYLYLVKSLDLNFMY
jgi:hypothetical protein